MPVIDGGSVVDEYSAKPKVSKSTNIGSYLIELNSRERSRRRLEDGLVGVPKKFGAFVSVFDSELEAMLSLEV
jgi:hypothetical protein